MARDGAPVRTLLLICLAACGPAEDTPTGSTDPSTPTTDPTTPPTPPTGSTGTDTMPPTGTTGATGSTGGTATTGDTATGLPGGDCTVGGPDLALTDAGVELSGGVADARVGNAMVAIGDVTGDGLDDVLVGSDHGNVLYLVAGDPSPTAGPIETAAWAVIDGEPDGELGISLSSAGDVDGDGLVDVWIGDGRMGEGVGGAHLLRGADLRAGRHAITDLTDTRLFGTAPDEATTKVEGVGDLTGDGIDDVALTGQSFDGRRGIVHVLAGPFAGQHTTAEAFATFRGAHPGDELGRLLAPGDLDGDGSGDLVLFATGTGDGTGAAYVVAGPLARGVVEVDDVPGRWLGEPGGLLGKSASALDLEGDGVMEVVVGSPYAEGSRGHAYLLRGVPNEAVQAVDVADGYWVGRVDDDRLGFAVETLADSDGDGVPEVLLGAKGESSEAGNGGAIYLMGDRPVGRVAVDPGTYALKIAGDSSFEFLGKPLSAGDLDGDGWPDVVIGAKNRDSGGHDAGAIVVRGCAR